MAKLSPTGSALDYSTFLGGNDWDGSLGIAIDSLGSIYVTGGTVSASFPTTNGAFDDAHNGYSDVFVAKLKLESTPVVSETALGRLPKACILHQNYPNPFNPETWINYQLPNSALATIKIYYVNGQLVNTLVDEEQAPGAYRVRWSGRNLQGTPLASGVYFCQFKAGDFGKTIKMVLMK
jgi:hypothetical protein